MRAASRPHSADSHASALTASDARAAMQRVLAVVVATAALLIVWRPAVVHSQTRPPAGVVARPAQVDSGNTATHVVKAGESLWSIASRYYGNGAAWTELARRNGLSVSSERPVMVGMRLKVPASPPSRASRRTAAKPKDLPKAAVAEAVPLKAAPAAAAPAGSLSSQTAGKPNAAPVSPRDSKSRPTVATVNPVSARREPKAAAPTPTPARSSAAATDTTPTVMSRRAVRLPAQPNPESMNDRRGRLGLVMPGDVSQARGREDSTLFLRRVPTLEDATASVRSAVVPQSDLPRRGEYDAAPFTMTAGQLLEGGQVGRRVGAAAVGSISGAQRALIADEVEVTPPPGKSLSVGDRLAAVRDVGKLLSGHSVVVPGGILQVVQADPGKPVVAVVKFQSGVIEEGMPLFAVEGGPAPAARPVASSGDALRASVVWVDQGSALPTLQSYLLLDAGTPQGVRAGDEFALVRTRGSATTGEEERIAVVRVVRSGPTGSTAIVIKQDRPEIATGVAARRVARLP